MARQPDNPLIRPATGRGRQFCNGRVRDVYADDGEIAIVQFPDVGTTLAADAFCAIDVRIRAEPSLECESRIHITDDYRTVAAKMQEQKPAIAGSMFPPASDRLLIVAAYRKSLGQAIRYYRKRVGLTQEQLGEKADLNPKYIGEVERMEKTISVAALSRIAKAVKVRVRDLVRDI